MHLPVAFGAPIRALVVFVTLAAVPAGAMAQTAAGAGDSTVVARVNGHEILAADVEDALGALPEQYLSLPPETLYKAVIDQLIDRHLLVSRARAQNLQNDLSVQRALRQIEARVLEQAYLRRVVESKVTDEAVRRRYQRDKDTLSGDKQVRARHILVKSQSEAMELLRELSRGKDFAELAREKSIGPSKSQGGDLGYFTRDAMLPAFSNVAFSLRKGEVSRAPVQTQYGWHVIKVEDIKEAGPPAFDEVSEELRGKMSDELVEAEIKRLREEASIERLNMPVAGNDPALQPVPIPR